MAKRKPCKDSITSVLGFCGEYPLVGTTSSYINITKVTDYHAGSTGYVDPYKRPHTNAPGCAIYYDYKCNTGPGSEGYTLSNYYCGIPESDSNKKPCVDTKITNSIYSNCFSHSIVTQSKDCYASLGGFKNLYAKKVWHGRLSYNSSDLMAPNYVTWCCSTSWKNKRNTADTTHYLAVQADSTVTLHTDVYCRQPTCGDCGAGDCADYTCNGYTVPNYCYTTVLIDTNDTLATANASETLTRYGNQTGNCNSSSTVPRNHTTCDSCCTNCVTTTDDDATYAANKELWASKAYNLLLEADNDITALATQYCDMVQSDTTPDVISGDGNIWELTWTATKNCSDGCNVTPNGTYNRKIVNVNLSAGTLRLRLYGLANPFTTGYGGAHSWCDNTAYCDDVVLQHDEQWEYSGTSYSRTLDVTGAGSWSFSQQYHEEIHGYLSNPYTAKQAQDDLTKLFKQWDLGDDAQYPWRLDSDVTRGPMLSYGERESQSEPLIFNACFPIDNPAWKGQILGAPLPSGYDRFWNDYVPNYIMEGCTDPLTGCTSEPILQDFGGWSTEIGVPRATQWNDKWIAAQIPQGPFLSINQYLYSIAGSCSGDTINRIYGNVFFACAYAERRIRRPSYNFFRPCGKDRFQVLPESSSCISNVSGNTVTVNYAGNIASGDNVLIAGTANKDGIWNVTSDGAATVTLNTLIVSGSNIPALFDYGSGVAAKIRYKTLPVICGTIGIVSVSNLTASLQDNPHYLVDNDTVLAVTKYGSSDVVNIKYVDDGRVILKGGNLFADYVYLRNEGGPSLDWNDNEPKGQVTSINYEFNFRDVGEYNRLKAQIDAGSYDCDGNPLNPPASGSEPRAKQAANGMIQQITAADCTTWCLPFSSACGNDVIYSSPVSYSFDSFVRVPWATKFVADGVYGAAWQATIKQHMDDPLFKAPPCTCYNDTVAGTYYCKCTAKEDDGNCLADTDPESLPCYTYYAHRDQYEAVCSLPTGAPPLPQGVYIGNCSAAQANVTGTPNCLIVNPDINFTDRRLPVIGWTPWVLINNEDNCVCSEGRFTSEYQLNAAQCINSEVPI